MSYGFKKKKIASLAIINTHNQIIISGETSAVNQASINCKNFGAKYILNLNINIAVHCSLMKPISNKLKKILNFTTVNKPDVPVINNVNVKTENTSKKIKEALIKQIYCTVRWKEVIDSILLKKSIILVEIGPGKKLTNLNKKNQHFLSCSTNNVKNFFSSLQKIN